jgi:hypothetical protein
MILQIDLPADNSGETDDHILFFLTHEEQYGTVKVHTASLLHEVPLVLV